MKFAPCFALLLFLAFFSRCGQTNSEVVNKDSVKETAENVAALKEIDEKESADLIPKNAENDKTEGRDIRRGSEYAAPYICVDRCKHSGSAMPGKCRTCGKDYVKNENYVKSKYK